MVATFGDLIAVARWICGCSEDVMAHLVALQTTEAVNPSSNPASPTVDKNSNEDRQGHCVYFKISCAFVIRQIVYSSVPVLIRQVSTLFRVVNSVKVSIFLTDCALKIFSLTLMV